MATTSNWTDKNARHPQGGPLNMEQIIQGVLNATQNALLVETLAPTTSFVNSAATTNATSTKATAGTVRGVVASNINAAARYLKLYNKATAPTVGTDVPVLTIALPALTTTSINLGGAGVYFGTGIAWALTVLPADSDTTAVAANEIKVGISYT